MTRHGAPGYDPRAFPPMAVTVDVVLFTIVDEALQLLLIERGVEPFFGAWALPGGFVQPEDETLDQAAARELAEETDVGPGTAYLEQLGSYGAVDRDPRMRVVSVAYWAACSYLPRPRRRQRRGAGRTRSRVVGREEAGSNSPSTMVTSSATPWSDCAPSWSTRPWERGSVGRLSRSANCGRSTR